MAREVAYRIWHPVTLGLTLRKDGWDYVAWRLKFALRVPEGHIITVDYRGWGRLRWALLLPLLTLRRRHDGWIAACRWAFAIMRHGWPPFAEEA